MVQRLGYYVQLTLRDIYRLWPSVQHHVAIVAGICLPILLLLGLKNGVVEDLQNQIKSNADACAITVWLNRGSEDMTNENLEIYRAQIDGIDAIIPHEPHAVKLANNSVENPTLLRNLTVVSTTVDDPSLSTLGLNIGKYTDDTSRCIIVNSRVANKLGVKEGDKLELIAGRRARAGMTEEATLEMTIVGIHPSTDEKDADAYADYSTLLEITRYKRGGSVPRFDWPPLKAAAKTTYAGYCIFSSKKRGSLTRRDIKDLEERGYSVTKISNLDDIHLRELINPELADDLEVYKIYPKRTQEGDWGYCSELPKDIKEFTKANDVVIAWNSPKLAKIGTNTFRLLGLTLPKRTWLNKYFNNSSEWIFNKSDPVLSAAIPNNFTPDSKHLMLSDSTELLLEIRDLEGFLSEPEPLPLKQPGEAKNLYQPPPGDEFSTVFSERRPTTPSREENQVLTEPHAQKTAADRDASNTIKQGKTQDQLTNNNKSPGPSDTKSKVELSAELPPDVSAPPESSEIGLTGVSTDGVDRITESKIAPSSHVLGLEQKQNPIAVVPVKLLSYVYAFENGKVNFDQTIQMFTPLNPDPKFEKLRVFAKSIHTVPSVMTAFREKGFAVKGREHQILRMQKQTDKLTLIVYIVGLGVFGFGTITVFSLLIDSTARKKGTLGILRVMGVSRFGIFFIVFLRAAVIAILATLVTIACGEFIAAILSHKTSIKIYPTDLIAVSIGAIICCGFGSLLPAIKASRMDPFDAIVEGRFR